MLEYMESYKGAISSYCKCAICQKLARALDPSHGYRVPILYSEHGARLFHLSSWKELQGNKECPACSRVASYFLSEFLQNDPNSIDADCWFCLFDYAGEFLCLRLQKPDEFASSLPRIYIRPWLGHHADQGAVLLDPHWISLHRISKWIETCNKTHSSCHCPVSPLEENLSSRGMYLINLVKKCLVKTTGLEKYVALSYVWGEKDAKFTTKKANVESLQEEGSLSSDRMRNLLPGTIQRAISFTSLLGVEYLWIDCLCTIQDDPVHFESQIKNMAQIYSNSYITLCAADGEDAESGLRGVPGCSLPRDIHQDLFSFTDGDSTVSWMPVTHPKIHTWSTRGWTFQENALSRRSLYFKDNGLQWSCQEEQWDEQCAEARYMRAADMVVLSNTLWPDLQKWDTLVASYLKRNLRYDGDMLRACTGVLDALGKGMENGFHYGLPEQFFDAGLLWIPCRSLLRRENTRGNGNKVAFPSWSWAGWKGLTVNQIGRFGFGLEHLRSTHLQDRLPRDSGIYPCVTWFKVVQGTFEKIRISNNYAEYRKSGLAGTLNVPAGWRMSWDGDGGQLYYKYRNAPAGYTFWYPLPTCRYAKVPEARQWAPLLFCKTLKGDLKLGRLLSLSNENEHEYPQETVYSLSDSEGNWAGIIHTHSLKPMTGTSNRCELILISGGWAKEDGETFKDFPEYSLPERHRLGPHYYFYHVLWIEWEGPIAYRKGLGRVTQSAWDAIEKKEMEVFLG